MDRRVFKLKHRGFTTKEAEMLVEAGLGSPKLIKAASDSQLLAIKGFGVTQVSNIRKKLR